MPAVRLHVDPVDEVFADGLAAIRAEMDIEDLPAAAIAEADAAISALSSSAVATDWADLTELPFVTIDPPGSRDLDQALHISAEATGCTIQYAVADLAAFVRPGGAIDDAARERGVTIYLPDSKSPLHPLSLSEGAASLLPDQVRRALVWRVRIDDDGEVNDVDVRRATVRSRGAYSYEQVQAALDAGTADEVFELLRRACSTSRTWPARRSSSNTSSAVPASRAACTCS